MPKIIANSISLLSDAGLGMAMFSLGKETYNTLSERFLRSITSCFGAF
jgi:hypothetical protein